MEAFAIARRFEHSEVIGVDFSPRSIAIALDLQKRKAGLRHVRFVVGDITSKHLVNTVGNDFDLISCHGVLSYIPQTKRALDNFARCLTPDGALYLGVNGARIFSATWRPALAAFGFQLAKFEDGKELREALKLCEALDSHHATRIADRGAEYLAGDLFGPLIHNWPLARWISLAHSAGLHFLGSYYAHRALRPIFKHDLYRRTVTSLACRNTHVCGAAFALRLPFLAFRNAAAAKSAVARRIRSLTVARAFDRSIYLPLAKTPTGVAETPSHSTKERFNKHHR
jgi:SAM-dependent methyltransferase